MKGGGNIMCAVMFLCISLYRLLNERGAKQKELIFLVLHLPAASIQLHCVFLDKNNPYLYLNLFKRIDVISITLPFNN